MNFYKKNMMLYVLRDPPEHKFSPLTELELGRCLTQTALESHWAPYPRRGCQIENICGKFLQGADGASRARSSTSWSAANRQAPHLHWRLGPVSFRASSPFGTQTELYHLAGHVTSRSTPGLARTMIFKGVRGEQGLEALRRDLLFDGVGSAVHMAVVSSCLGKRVQTSADCYLENRVRDGTLGWLGVESRCLDQCNVVRLRVVDFAGLLPQALRPLTNDIVVTGRGSVLHRLTWRALPWDEWVERDVLDGCERVVDGICEAV